MHHGVGRRRGTGGARRAARALIMTGAAAAATVAGLLGGPAIAATAQATKAANAPVASTPPMGYNTWYQYHGGNESVVLAQARALVSTGLATAGYEFVNLDDGWLAATRTASGALTWNPRLYPHGLPWLAGQLHAMGLKFGIYAAIGNQT